MGHLEAQAGSWLGMKPHTLLALLGKSGPGVNPGAECGAIFSAHMGAGNGNSLQDSCLGNPMDREGWKAEVHGVAEQA